MIGAYGTGSTPAILGSDRFDTPELWHDDGDNRWYLQHIKDEPGMVLHDGQYGVRRTTLEALADPWDFYHDGARKRLYVHSDTNPATQASRIEIPVREFAAGPLEADHVILRELAFGHGWNMSLLAWDGDHLTLDGCRFVASPGNHVQFNNGSNFGDVTGCHFDDWNTRDTLAYAVQVIAEGSGPVDIERCEFRASRRGGGDDHTAIMNDFDGWVRTVRHCTFQGNGGALADEGVVIWRPNAAADVVVISDNTFEGVGGTAIGVQELNHYGARPDVQIVRNRITGACLRDDLDKEALRARLFGAESPVLIAYNVVDGVPQGSHPHPGIGVREVNGLRIVNNLVRGADTGIELKQTVENVFLRNNIVVGNRGAGIYVGPTARNIDSNHNCLHTNGDGAVVGGSVGDNTLTADPMLDQRLALQPGSPCIDAGAAIEGLKADLGGTAVPQGDAPDIGVLEYVP